MKFLLDVTETYRVDNEKEAAALIDYAKKNQRQYALSKYSSTQRERKQKGEVVDTWYKVTLSKKFNDEKEPYNAYSIQYTDEGNFPESEEEDDNED